MHRRLVAEDAKRFVRLAALEHLEVQQIDLIDERHQPQPS